MDWEAPVPIWMDSINIGMDELAVSDLMVSMPYDMNETPLLSTPKVNTFVSTLTEPSSSSSPFLDVEGILPDNMMLNVKDITLRNNSSVAPTRSVVRRKSSAKSARRSSRKVKPDPSDRDQRRKDKQRGYETSYRKRQKNKRDRDQAEWVQLETQLRKLLTKRTSFVVVQSSMENANERSTKSILCHRYFELLQEERALREAKALDDCVLAENQALAFWGGANSKTRDMREKINTFPTLRGCHMFEFSW
ncbi:hypothetical protein PsorP6_012128 [Peronosclerospora sorghi]|uniref:Uncharacterized protein n=1 Tax=Peronosclerospora sorghi TaxID=230839 RepID=A0ACC0WJZ5_9STRA|nr:hypothetical protein PsorP6_012128 [Peronosclerospora sorghi]